MRINHITRTAAAIVAGLLAANASAQSECVGGFVTVADQANGKIWLFDAVDGSLVNPDFIPPDANMVAPIHAVCTGESVLVSDPGSDSIFEYDFGGSFLTTLADNASSGIDDPRGISVYNEQVYVTVNSGAHADTVQRFGLDGTGQATWATSDNLDGPSSLFFRQADALVANRFAGTIERYDTNGVWQETFVSTLDAPEQTDRGFNNGALVGEGGTPAGVHLFDSGGVPTGFVLPVQGSVYGVHLLTLGGYMFTDDAGVHIYDPFEDTYQTVVSGSGFRYVAPILVPTPSSLALLCLGGLAVSRRRR